MKVTKTKNGVYNNTWVEGDKVVLQDLKTGKTRTVTREQHRRDNREVKDMNAARNYANGDS